MKRVDANLVPFAKNNSSGYRFAFGTDTATDDINVNYNDNIKKGWGTTPNEFPEVEDFNAMAYTTGYLLSYLYHMGISEWNDKQEYRQYSRVVGSNGILYKAITGTDISPNINNNPTTDTTNWEIDNQFDINSLNNKTTPANTDNFAIQEAGGLLKKLSWANLKASLISFFVDLSSNQTISGIKSFTGNLLMTGSSSVIGYGDGSGIAVTQLTSKTTPITANKSSGTITLSNSALAAGATAVFTVNNSLVSAGDKPYLVMKNSVAGAEVYSYRVGQVNAGSFQILIKNESGVSRSDAAVIGFNVFKGAEL